MKQKRIQNIIKEAMAEKMTEGSTMSLAQLEAMDTDGDAYFTLSTVLDAFKAGIEIGCQTVGQVTNYNARYKEEEEC